MGTQTIHHDLALNTLTADTLLELDSNKKIISSSVTTADLDKITGITNGIASANKALVVDGSKDISGINDVSLAGLTSTDLTANRALISDGAQKIISSSVTNTELGYVSGVTSAIQTQLDAKIEDGDTIDTLIFDPTAGIPSHSEGLAYYDNVNKCLAYFNNDSDVAIQIGQEVVIRVYNDTGSDITNGKVCYLSGVFSGFPTVDLAQANSSSTCLSTLGFASHLIEDGTYGYIIKMGTARNLSTSGFTAGDIVYLSETTAGAFTDTAPASPNYVIRLGNAAIIDGSTGTIEVQINVNCNTQDTINLYNGNILEHSDIDVTATPTTITLSLEKDGGGDLSLFFDGEFYIFSSSPAATVNLTAGSDTAPTLNYVYIPNSTKTLTANTTGFPTTEQIIPIAEVLCQSAASAQTYGAYSVADMTNHVADQYDQGHLAHLNEWVHNNYAIYKSGVAPTTTVVTNPTAIDNVYFSNTSGIAYRLLKRTFPARDMQTGDEAYVVNDSTTAYDRITDLGAIDTDSTGATLRSNNTYYSLVILGVISEDADDCKLFVNVPSGFYTSEADAIADTNNYSTYTIGNNIKGSAFLIARVILRYQTADSGTFTEIDTEDLRGLIPSTSAGGGGGGTATNEFSDNLFRIQNVTDSTKEIAFSAASITTGNVRTITMPDNDLTLIGKDTTDTLTNKTLTTPVINVGSDAQGDVYFRNAGGQFARLAPGVSGQFLKTQGAAADPVWSTPAGGGDVLGPASNADDTLPTWNGVDSKTLQDSGVTIDDLKIESLIVPISDEVTDLTTGTAKVTFRMPYAFTLLTGSNGVRASVNTAPTGSTITVDINEGGVTILSTKLTIDAGEKTSTTAATPPVISDTSLADDAEITIDIDQVGSTIAGKGLKVVLIGRQT